MYCGYIHVLGTLVPSCTFLPSLSFFFLVHILISSSAAYLRIIFITFLHFYFCFFHFSFDFLFKFFVTLLPHFYCLRSSFFFYLSLCTFRSSIVFIYPPVSLLPRHKDPTTAPPQSVTPSLSVRSVNSLQSKVHINLVFVVGLA